MPRCGPPSGVWPPSRGAWALRSIQKLAILDGGLDLLFEHLRWLLPWSQTLAQSARRRSRAPPSVFALSVRTPDQRAWTLPSPGSSTCCPPKISWRSDQRCMAAGHERTQSGSGGPLLEAELGHREVLDVPRGQPAPDAGGCGGNQAVRLAQGYALRSVDPAPAPGKLAFTAPEGGGPKARQEG